VLEQRTIKFLLFKFEFHLELDFVKFCNETVAVFEL
jgi:hypothetical protein